MFGTFMAEEKEKSENDVILENLSSAREQLRDLFLQVKPTDGMLGIYIEPTRAGGIKESGFILGEPGSLTAYSLTRSYFTDEVLTVQQLENLTKLYNFFSKHLKEDVFIHSDKKSPMSKNPTWIAVLWDKRGRYMWQESSFGYSFRNQDKFGNSDSGSSYSFHDSNVSIWADYLNEQLVTGK